MIVNLNGVGELKQLNRLDIYGARRLGSLDQLKKLPSLETLTLTKCKALADSLSSLGECKALRELQIDDIGTIENVKFADNLEKLEYFRFVNTKIIDGDLENLFRKYRYGNLKTVQFKNARHYSHKLKDFGIDIRSPFS